MGIDVLNIVHGCLLRLSRPDAPSQSYLVDAVFSKRGDAKLAVCLYACSQGVCSSYLFLDFSSSFFFAQLGDFIRRVAAEIDARVTPLMRRQCLEEYMPQMGQALSRIKHGLRPEYQFTCDLASECSRFCFRFLAFVFAFFFSLGAGRGFLGFVGIKILAVSVHFFSFVSHHPGQMPPQKSRQRHWRRDNSFFLSFYHP